jgi:hypothetical protein
MTTFSDIYGCERKAVGKSSRILRNDQLIGIEIELENAFLKYGPYGPCPYDYWEIVGDDSLRPRSLGKELRFTRPLFGRELLSAISELTLKKKHVFNGTPTFSERTGTHFHVNISDLDPEQVCSIFFGFLIFQDVFYKMGSIKYNRKYTFYARDLNLIDAVPTLAADWADRSRDAGVIMDGIVGKVPKYCSAYIKANIGTMEFRCFDSTLSSSRLLFWTKAIMKFGTFFKENIVYDRPQSKSEYMDLARHIWGEMFYDMKQYLKGSFNNKNELIPSRIQDIITGEDLVSFSQVVTNISRSN